MNETMKVPSTDQVNDFFGWMEDFWKPISEVKKTAPVNIKTNDNKYHIEVAVPGMKKEDIKIELNNGMLTISSETKTEKETKEDNYTRKEFSYSSFARRFQLPENADENNITAKCENGLLKIDIAKTEAELPNKKTIQID